MGKNLKGKELGKGLSQRKDGRFSARFVSESLLDKSGKPKRIEKYFDDLVEAKLWLTDAQYEDRHGHLAASSRMTVDAWFKQWISDKELTQRPNTVRNYRERYTRNIQPYIGRMTISSVKAIHCQNILKVMVNDGYAGSTIKQCLLTMGIMFKAAVVNDIIAKSPTKTVKNPKTVETKVRFLTIDEQKKFLAAAEGSSNYPQYRFLLQTGLRVGEMIGLKWEDVDFDNRVIHIKRSLEFRYSTQSWNWGPTKSKAGTRDVPMTDECYQVLREVQHFRKNSQVVIVPEFKDNVFLNRKGTPTKNSAYDSHLFKLADKAGIERFSMHRLRHTFATRCIEAGVNPKTLQTILGHANLQKTMDLYVHVTDDTKQNEMQKFAAYSVAI